jgi:hypothetical protein
LLGGIGVAIRSQLQFSVGALNGLHQRLHIGFVATICDNNKVAALGWSRGNSHGGNGDWYFLTCKGIGVFDLG